METIKEITVDLYERTLIPLVTEKQGDRNSRVLRINITEHGSPFLIPSGVQAYINVKKPDGTAIYNICTIENNKVVARLTNQFLAAYGKALCDIEFKKNDYILSSATFVMQIDEGAKDERAFESRNESTVIEEKIKEIDNAIENQNKRVTNFITSARSDVDSSITRVNVARKASEEATKKINTLTDAMEKKVNEDYWRGLQGEQGIQGAQGVKGDKGDTGTQGVQGLQGVKGDKGDKGDRGDSGIVTPINGMFVLSGDEEGNLYAYYSDENSPPKFEVDENNNIYYVIG